MRFYTSGLLSKWGFGDGDMLDEFLADHELNDADSHQVLIKIVRDKVLPVIKQEVSVFEVVTLHSPIRTERVNGEPVSDTEDNPGVKLTPEFVIVDDEDIIRIATGTI